MRRVLLPVCSVYASHRVYTTFEELCEDYKSGALHPGDLKPALSRHINMILQPVRDHFTNDPHAAELLKKVKVRGDLVHSHATHHPQSGTVVQNHPVTLASM